MRSRTQSLGLALGAALALLTSGSGCGRGSGTPALPSATPSARASAPSVATNASDSPVAQGARAFQQYCQLCHAKDGTGYAADNAPSLVSKTYLESATNELIAAGIRMGRPGTAMAAYGKGRGGPLEEREIDALVAFLRSKGPVNHALPAAEPSGDLTRGAEVYEKNCVTCHGKTGVRGNAVSLLNPEFLAAASPAFLHFAVVNGRPPTPMPAFAGKLSPTEITDVVSWLWSFKPALPTPAVENLTVPKDLPVVIHPQGKRPQFTLRDERFVSVEQVKKALDAKQRIVIVDARASSDWIQFHIPGAVSVPYHDRSLLDRIPNDGTWVVAYCACPHHASGEVVDALRAKKYANTAVMDEGILFWKDHNYPLIGEAIPAKNSAGPQPSPASPRASSPKPRPSANPTHDHP